MRIRQFVREAKRELLVLAGTLAIAATGDIVYKTIEVAKTTMIGTTLHALSGFGYTMFVFMCLFHFLFGYLFKSKFFDMFKTIGTYQEPEQKPRKKK